MEGARSAAKGTAGYRNPLTVTSVYFRLQGFSLPIDVALCSPDFQAGNRTICLLPNPRPQHGTAHRVPPGQVRVAGARTGWGASHCSSGGGGGGKGCRARVWLASLLPWGTPAEDSGPRSGPSTHGTAPSSSRRHEASHRSSSGHGRLDTGGHQLRGGWGGCVQGVRHFPVSSSTFFTMAPIPSWMWCRAVSHMKAGVVTTLFFWST